MKKKILNLHDTIFTRIKRETTNFFLNIKKLLKQVF